MQYFEASPHSFDARTHPFKRERFPSREQGDRIRPQNCGRIGREALRFSLRRRRDENGSALGGVSDCAQHERSRRVRDSDDRATRRESDLDRWFFGEYAAKSSERSSNHR